MARLRGGAVTAAVVLAAVAGCTTDRTKGTSGPERSGGDGAVLTAVDSLTVKGRAPKTGYARARFGTAWADTDVNSCDTRVISVLRGVIAGLSQLIRGVVRCAY
ncbi:hypothetical protein ABB07_22290 [Streptomyces incarnatus]|uniref:Lipoprotein n=1 Tax=Streptomyces incarnatus TaxID=665007 RepID=A0ABM5TNY2_9ACTN|nr:hypothetical protein ABB07_22290 [Streptomyces incarnatus]